MTAKNKQSNSFAALIADSELKSETIEVGDHSIIVQEMTGRQRFELSEKEQDNRWDTLLWVCSTGIVEPKPADMAELEQIRPEWIVEIANSILRISGLEANAEEEAGNESASVTDIGGS